MSHASTASSAVSFFSAITTYLDNHTWVGIVIGVFLLLLGMYWPELRHRITLPKPQAAWMISKDNSPR